MKELFKKAGWSNKPTVVVPAEKKINQQRSISQPATAEMQFVAPSIQAVRVLL